MCLSDAMLYFSNEMLGSWVPNRVRLKKLKASAQRYGVLFSWGLNGIRPVKIF